MKSVMRAGLLCGLITLTSLATRPAHADTITDLFNTGVDNTNTLLTGGTPDPHYTMIANDAGLTNGTSALVNTDQLVGTWADNPTSLYISPDGGDGGAVNGGGYSMVYQTTFTLPGNVVLSSVDIEGFWSTDNLGDDILVNGVSTGITSPSFTAFTPFTIPTTALHAGTNTLDFAWTNQGGPGGLNVYFSTKTFNVTAGAAAPEPGSAVLLGTGLPGVGLVLLRRRFRKTAA